MRNRIGFFFTEALRSMSTNKATSFAAIIAMLVALLIIGLAAAVVVNAEAHGARLKEEASIVKVFLKPTVTDAQINAITKTMQRDSNVRSVQYISKEQALAEARKQFEDDPEILDSLPSNPFPASVEVRLANAERMDSVTEKVKGAPGVEEVKTGEDDSRAVVRNVTWGVGIGIVVGAGLLIAATILVSNTIRLSIYARRREIEVMKLVGASNSFVRVPFMLEGVLCGIIAAIIASGSVAGLIWAFRRYVLERLATGSPLTSRAPLETAVNLPTILAGLIVLGLLLGIVGSMTSMRRYLRV